MGDVVKSTEPEQQLVHGRLQLLEREHPKALKEHVWRHEQGSRVTWRPSSGVRIETSGAESAELPPQTGKFTKGRLFYAKGFSGDFSPSAELQLIYVLEAAALVTNSWLFSEDQRSLC